MHKQIIFAALMCNIFSISAMNEEISSSPKDTAREKFAERIYGRQKDAARSANRTKKYERYNGKSLEEQDIVEEATRAALKSSKEWLELAKKNSDDLLRDLVEKNN
jgi:hypothetical protein